MTRLAFTTRVLKPLGFIACLIPLARLVAEAFGFGYLGADPVHTVQVVTGIATLVILFVTLAVSPVRKLFGWGELIRLRRMLGLFAFFYLVLHVVVYFVLDQSLDPGLIWSDTVEHPRIAVGFAAFLMLIPLAVTSTDRMIRRLGRRWGTLHRLVYAATALGVLHFLMVQKLDIREGLVYSAIFAGLMLFRLPPWLGRARRGAPARRPAPAVVRPTEDLS